MRKLVVFLILLAICLPSLSVSADDGFLFAKSGNEFDIISEKIEFEDSFLVIARYTQADGHQNCEIVSAQIIKFTDGKFLSGVITMEQGYDYKYMVFDGYKPAIGAVTLNTKTPDGVENGSDDGGTPRF